MLQHADVSRYRLSEAQARLASELAAVPPMCQWKSNHSIVIIAAVSAFCARHNRYRRCLRR